MNTNTIRGRAIAAIDGIVQQEQTRLDSAAAAARADNLTQTRAALLGLVAETDPLYPVCELLAHTLSIGRDDGYPERRAGDGCNEIVGAALTALGAARRTHPLARLWRADRLSLEDLASKAAIADYAAWEAAREYRARTRDAAAKL